MGNNIYGRMSLEKLNELYWATKSQLDRIEKEIIHKTKMRRDAIKAVESELDERLNHFLDNYNAVISLGLPPNAKFLSRHYYPPVTEHEYLTLILHPLVKAHKIRPPSGGLYKPNLEEEEIEEE